MLTFSTYKGRNDKDTDSTAPKQIKDGGSRAEQTSAIISAEEVAAQKGARKDLDCKLRDSR